jgi:hypothetical protein
VFKVKSEVLEGEDVEIKCKSVKDVKVSGTGPKGR